ncbi:GIY-YIG nuclease family protein [Pseudomonas sp. SP16.1]|uniref:GIY-YIG nuclease family protein n=1 Tax=Pseudomonas sp. SP16.1 TaxID=3458854 RepID=UPI00404669B2
MKQPAVYIMASQRNGTLYTGVTANLLQRIWQHREEVVAGFTRRYGVKMLVWYEQHESMSGAIAREKAIKKWSRAWKLRLIEEQNPHWQDLWPEIIGASSISAGSPSSRE